MIRARTGPNSPNSPLSSPELGPGDSALLPEGHPDRCQVRAVWDPVTEGDRAGERIMRAMIEERFPDHGIHGEEYGLKPSRSGFTWVLDPVDGTRAFISGMPTWATLIGLNFEGRPKVGVMNQPFVGETFYGNPEGAWSLHQGTLRKLATRPARPLAQATFTTTAPELYRSRCRKRRAEATHPGGQAHPLWRGCLFLLRARGRADRSRNRCAYGAL